MKTQVLTAGLLLAAAYYYSKTVGGLDMAVSDLQDTLGHSTWQVVGQWDPATGKKLN